MMITASDILVGLYIAVAVFLLIVLYHTLFVVVDLRKILHRVEEITEQLENMLMKPISIADQLLQKAVELVEKQQKKVSAKKSHSKKS